MTSSTEPNPHEPVDAFLRRTFGSEIHPGRETRLLAEDPSLAFNLARRLDAEPLPDGIIAPSLPSVPDSIAPAAYVMHIYTHKCSVCHHESRHSETFAEHHLKSRSGSTLVRNQRPAAALEWQVPLRIHQITTRIVAGCHECLEVLRSDILPSLPLVPEPIAPAKYTAPAEPKVASATARPKDAKLIRTTDDLDF